MIARKAKTRVLPILQTVFSDLAQNDHRYETLSSNTSIDADNASKESLHPAQLIPFNPYQRKLTSLTPQE